MIKEDRLNRVLAGLSHTGYTTEIEKCEARLFIEELFKENNKYKEVIDKLNNKINSLKTCEDKPKEDIIYPHWEICNETKQEMLDILKEVK